LTVVQPKRGDSVKSKSEGLKSHGLCLADDCSGGWIWARCRGCGRCHRLRTRGSRILPGKQRLDELDGACSVPGQLCRLLPSAVLLDQFFSSARVALWLHDCLSSWPSTWRPTFTYRRPPRLRRQPCHALKGMTPAQAVALRPQHDRWPWYGGRGNGYWTPRPHDDRWPWCGELIHVPGAGSRRQPSRSS